MTISAMFFSMLCALPIFEIVLFLEDVKVVLTMFDAVRLVDDAGKVDGQDELDVLDFIKVLDVQSDVEVVLRDLL